MSTALGLAGDYEWQREQHLGQRHAEALRDNEKRAITYESFQSLGLLQPPTAAGMVVTQHTANSVAAYWNGLCVLSGDIGALDRHLYRRVGSEDDRERATSHPAYRIIHEQPNTDTTAMVFWETITSHAAGWGNGYAEIEWDGAMRPIGLWIITPDMIEPRREILVDSRGRMRVRTYYWYSGLPKPGRIEAEDILHIKGLGFDGVRGYSPVFLARQSLGLSMAAERFGATFFGNGAWPGVALEHPGKLSVPAQERLRDSIEGMHKGADRAHRLMILEEGMKASKPMTIPPEDAQFLQTREFQIEEIARWLNLPTHKLKQKAGARPGGNLEAAEMEYVCTSLMPWTTRIEQECDRKLIIPSQRSTYYTEHNYSKRLVADTVTRMGAYKTLYGMRAITAAEVARRENLPKPPAPLPTPTKPAALPAPIAEPPAPETKALVAARSRELLLDVVTRFMRREAENAKRSLKKGPPAFGDWVRLFYGNDEALVLRGFLTPAVGIVGAAMGSKADLEAIVSGLTVGYLDRSRQAFEELRFVELDAAVPRVLEQWKATRGMEFVDEALASIQRGAGNAAA